jgi:putative addiction module component (TIGR02574 family)
LGLKEFLKMVTLAGKIVDEALSLPSDQRIVLIDKLLKSLNIPSQKQIDIVWAKEAEKRYKELKSGKVKAIPGGHIFKEIHKKYVK